MALTRTTLAVAITANADRCKVTATTGATVGGIIQLDNEFALVQAINGLWISLKRRGTFGSAVVAHNILAGVVFGVASEFPATPPASPAIPGTLDRDVVTYGASGAIAMPLRDTVAFIECASAAALTLADPANLPDGIELIVISDTAQAHTLDLATGVYGSDSDDIFTFAAVGQSVRLMSRKGKWAHVGASLDVTETSGSYPTLA